jgi:DNA-binding CsgD family transcriptional regulator
MIADGHSNKGVANILGISLKIVETHRASVMTKLGLHSSACLVPYAVRSGLTMA